MPYSAEISRDNPTCLLFVIDQSGSMDEKMTTSKPKSVFVADVTTKRSIRSLLIARKQMESETILI